MDVNGDGEIDYEVAVLSTIVSCLMFTSISLSYIQQSESENVYESFPMKINNTYFIILRFRK